MTPGKRRPREMATVFVGRCPACDDFPDGEWFDGSEFMHWCGYELAAGLREDKQGAEHWFFRFATTNEQERCRINTRASHSPKKPARRGKR